MAYKKVEVKLLFFLFSTNAQNFGTEQRLKKKKEKNQFGIE